MIRSPASWVAEHASIRPDAPAVATPVHQLSYRQLAERVEVLASRLASAGVAGGDRVLIAAPNVPATIVAALASHSLGACAVEVTREAGAATFSRILAQTKARHVFASSRDASAWVEALSGVHVERLWLMHGGRKAPAVDRFASPVTYIGEDGTVAGSGCPPSPAPPRPVAPEDAALILYTSGSTGEPRGVVQTFRNIDANTRSIVEYLRLTPDDRAMLILPLSYCYGRSVLQTHLFVGGSVFLDPRFMYPRVVMETIGTEGCTGFAGVPLSFEILRRQVDVATIPRPRLRYVTQAGGAMAPDTIRWARQAFSPAQLFVMYGQTEATSRLSYLPPERAHDKHGSIGIPIPGVELRVVNDDGHACAVGESGHLVARGDNVTPGYYGAPDETAAILRDGWLWTGDLAYRDADGFFFHTGRAKEILKIGGHRVSPVEIEQRLAQHPDVVDAAVVGAPSAISGEVAVAFVVRRPGTSASDVDLRHFCREHLPAFKVPTRIMFVDALPRNPAGKLLRTELRAQLTPMDGQP